MDIYVYYCFPYKKRVVYAYTVYYDLINHSCLKVSSALQDG
jgi:hypothetical protein